MDSEQIKETLDIIGNKAGELIQASEPLTELMIKQYAITHAIYAIETLCLFAVAALLLFKLLKHTKNNWNELSNRGDEPPFAMGIFLLFVLSVITFFLFSENLVACIAPELHLLMDLVK